MFLKVLDAAHVFGIRITVGGRGECAVSSDPGHPLVDTAINLIVVQKLKQRTIKRVLATVNTSATISAFIGWKYLS